MTMTTDTLATAEHPAETRVLKLLDAFIVSDVECNGCRVHSHGQPEERWYDVRPMLDPREHSEEFIDMAQLGIEQGIARGVIRRDAQHAHLLQVLPVSWP